MTSEVAAELSDLKTVVDLRFIPAGFHEQPEILQRIIQREIDIIEEWNLLKSKSPSAAKFYDAILLGFGLCNKATVGVYARTIPIVIPRAHDCITLLLGSKERYQKFFHEKAGNYWYSCGWINRMLQPGPERDRLLRRRYIEKYGVENIEFLMETEQEWQKKYQQATFIDWKLPDTDKYREYTQKCAAYLNWSYETIHGDSILLKDFLNGYWDEERFLKVRPGEEVVPSYDPRIINSAKQNIKNGRNPD